MGVTLANGIAIASTCYVIAINSSLGPQVYTEQQSYRLAVINGIYTLVVVAVIITAIIVEIAQ